MRNSESGQSMVEFAIIASVVATAAAALYSVPIDSSGQTTITAIYNAFAARVESLSFILSIP